MQKQKIVSLINASSKFATEKWYVINDQNNTKYSEGNENDSSIKFEIKGIRSDVWDAYILVTEDITATSGDANTNVAFNNCAVFTGCVTHVNDEHIDTAKNLDITTSIYDFIEYSNSYSDTFGSWWQFKRDESLVNNDGNLVDVTTNNSTSFEYKRNIFKEKK